MKNTLIIVGFLGLALSGCAHSTMRGSVAMKTSEREAHVCLDKNEAKPGDQVRLFRNACSKGASKGERAASCEKTYLGNGVVKENLNDHYALVSFDEGVSFEEGTFVEKF